MSGETLKVDPQVLQTARTSFDEMVDALGVFRPMRLSAMLPERQGSCSRPTHAGRHKQG